MRTTEGVANAHFCSLDCILIPVPRNTPGRGGMEKVDAQLSASGELLIGGVPDVQIRSPDGGPYLEPIGAAKPLEHPKPLT